MFQNILPVGLIAVIRSLNVDSNTLQWNLETDGNNASVQLTWAISDCVAAANLVTVTTNMMRKKPPSTLKRDNERKSNFMRYGTWKSPFASKNENSSAQDEANREVLHGEAAVTTHTLKVSETSSLQTDHFSGVDTGTQTPDICLKSREVQTESIITEEKSHQVSVLKSDNSTNTAACTDNPPISSTTRTDASFLDSGIQIETSLKSNRSIQTDDSVSNTAPANIATQTRSNISKQISTQTTSPDMQSVGIYCCIVDVGQENENALSKMEHDRPIQSKSPKCIEYVTRSGPCRLPRENVNETHRKSRVAYVGAFDPVYTQSKKNRDKIVDIINVYDNQNGGSDITVLFESGRTGKVREGEIPYHVKKRSQFFQH